MSRGPSPLVGYNTNVRHKSKLYHIQTEDSGVNHPHIITHLFADGGRIIASKKTEYAQHLGSATLPGIVKRLMQEQHKAMFIALRDCVFAVEQIIARWSILGIKPGDWLAIGASMAMAGDRLQNPVPLKIGSMIRCSSPAIGELSHQVVVAAGGVRR